MSEPRRCDGCGLKTAKPQMHTDDDGNVMVKYCPGCESERQRLGIDPADHPQYDLYNQDNE